MCPLMYSFMVQYMDPLSLDIHIQFLQTNLQIIFLTELASVVQKLDSAIHPINHYTVDKILRDLSTG